jgi:DNA-binding NtrC family response regulator
MKKRVLVLDRDDDGRTFYKDVFYKSEIEIVVLKDLKAGLDLLKSRSPIDGVIVDFKLIEGNQRDSILEIRSTKPDISLVVVGETTTDKVIQCVKYGVDNFIEKFKDKNVIQKIVKEVLDKHDARFYDAIKKELDPMAADSNNMIGQSLPILKLKRQIQKLAPLDSTILVLGETGTGKEVTSRMIHHLSPQSQHNFIPVHCGGIPDTLLESALFGHEKGSFTGAYKTHQGYFEVANNGTIFLDEIGDTTPSFQVKLLRVLQDKQYRRVGGTELLETNARIIAATNRDLKSMIEEDKFREDLYYRLNVISLRIPPVRERPSDIPLFIRHFTNIFCKKHNKLGVYLKPETIEILQKHHWKGNVREIENVVERLIALTETDWVGPDELPKEFLQPHVTQYFKNSPFLPFSEAKTLFEREYILKLMAKAHGNVTKAAKLANIPRQNLHLKIKKHDLNVNGRCKATEIAFPESNN